jgi:hypothetical protein
MTVYGVIITYIDPSEVISPAAYVLYYRRQDVAVDFDLEWISARVTAIPLCDDLG